MKKTILTLGLTLPLLTGISTTPAQAQYRATPQEALQKDLGLNPQEAQNVLNTQKVAAETDQHLQAQIGESHYAGSTFDVKTQKLNVKVTNEQAAATVASTGNNATVVKHSVEELTVLQQKIDAAKIAGVTSTSLSPESNQVIISVKPEAQTTAQTALKTLNADSSALKIETTTATASTFKTQYHDGDQYIIHASDGDWTCSVGFAGKDSRGKAGFMTAGHCGGKGSTVTGTDNMPWGTFTRSNFPHTDMAWVSTNNSLQAIAEVNEYQENTFAPIHGDTAMPVGSAVCRSGFKTGWHCGTIEAMNSTVNYSDGTQVNGLTQTNACADHGDSGGSWISGDQAQGVTSGGSGDCKTGGTTYFQPLKAIETNYSVSLLTE